LVSDIIEEMQRLHGVRVHACMCICNALSGWLGAFPAHSDVQESRPLTERIKEAIGLKSSPQPVYEVKPTANATTKWLLVIRVCSQVLQACSFRHECQGQSAWVLVLHTVLCCVFKKCMQLLLRFRMGCYCLAKDKGTRSARLKM